MTETTSTTNEAVCQALRLAAERLTSASARLESTLEWVARSAARAAEEVREGRLVNETGPLGSLGNDLVAQSAEAATARKALSDLLAAMATAGWTVEDLDPTTKLMFRAALDRDGAGQLLAAWPALAACQLDA